MIFSSLSSWEAGFCRRSPLVHPPAASEGLAGRNHPKRDILHRHHLLEFTDVVVGVIIEIVPPSGANKRPPRTLSRGFVVYQ